ncbi:MAG: hypothetical protein IJ003_04190 [Candidatus Gastranaerophilales bacterium]|nr:hypothetical protein [Candidatus Gastranaerophilales bacterium]
MEKDKVRYLKEKQMEKKAQKNYDFLESKYAQNPIKAKFLAFQKTKKDINPKDLF